jgi:hypothetical protein
MGVGLVHIYQANWEARVKGEAEGLKEAGWEHKHVL